MAVNSEGKTVEATRNLKEALQSAQQRPTGEQKQQQEQIYCCQSQQSVCSVASFHGPASPVIICSSMHRETIEYETRKFLSKSLDFPGVMW